MSNTAHVVSHEQNDGVFLTTLNRRPPTRSESR